LLYSTTPEFLQYVGVNDVSELPKPKEIEDLLGSGQEELPFVTDEIDEKITEEISTLDEGDNEELGVEVSVEGNEETVDADVSNNENSNEGDVEVVSQETQDKNETVK